MTTPLKPHDYVPSTIHMGDCYICGHVREAPIHSKSRDVKKTLLGVAVDDPNLIGPGTDLTNVFPEEEP